MPEQKISDIANLIADTIRPEFWRPAGPGSISVAGMRLVVVCPAVVHDEVRDFLRAIRDGDSRPVNLLRIYEIGDIAAWYTQNMLTLERSLPESSVKRLRGLRDRAGVLRDMFLDNLELSSCGMRCPIRGTLNVAGNRLIVCGPWETHVRVRKALAQLRGDLGL